jgi:hypothetical protein
VEETVSRAEGGWPSVAEDCPSTADRGRFHASLGIFRHKLPPRPLSPPDYRPIFPSPIHPPFFSFPAVLPPNGEKQPLLSLSPKNPPPYPHGRPPPQPSLDGIAEAVCITPFALYYDP